MLIYKINPNITAFYFGGDTCPDNPNLNVTVEDNWVIGACEALGVACYAIHNDDSAIIYDTLCSPEQAEEIRSYLTKEIDVKKISVVLSHWHLDHVGGNELYKNCNIIGTRKTREQMLLHKKDIENGTLWGEPCIKPLREPDIVFDDNISIFLGELEIQLYNINIHTEDSLCAYIPKYKILLPGDMLEDTAPFITNPEAIPEHIKNCDCLRNMDIEKILPNHGRSFIIRKGGYTKELIDCVVYYLENIYFMLQNNHDMQMPNLQTFMATYLDKDIVHYWPPYDTVHLNNIERVRSFFKGEWSPDGQL